MNPTRLLPALAVILCGSGGAETFLIGTSTHGESEGIYAADFDPADGSISELRLAAEAPSPGFLAWHPELPVVYAIGPDSSAGFRSTGSAELTEVNRVATSDRGACHLAVHPSGRGLAVASYGGGGISGFLLEDDGRIAPPALRLGYEGSSVNERRQNAPHPHGIHFAGDLMLVPDLGTDRIMAHRFDPSGGLELPAAEPPFTSTEPGDGPRHATFHPSGRFVFVNHELSNVLEVFQLDGERLVSSDRASTLPADWSGENTTAEVVVHPNGRWAFVSNRGHESIALFAFDPDSGKLERRAIVPCGARTPRHFTLTPDGRWLLVGGQSSDDIHVMSFDPESGELALTPASIPCPHPICLLFLPQDDRFSP